MFSDMNKVTQKIPTARDQRPQSADTREEIRRHDPEQERKKGSHKGFAKEQGIFGDDQTEVSVQSLETFLPMLLKNYSEVKPSIDKVETSERIDQTNPNAKAAGAYARMAKYNPANNPAPQKTQEVDAENIALDNDNPKLSKTEIQMIHRLQADVVKLKKLNIPAIFINKAGTFLESLENAIQDAFNSAKS